MTMWPEEELPAARWLELFHEAGFVATGGHQPPTTPLTLYRACDPGRERRLTWALTADVARWFAREHGRAELWRAEARPEAVVAMFGFQPAVEVVVDPVRLQDLERL